MRIDRNGNHCRKLHNGDSTRYVIIMFAGLSKPITTAFQIGLPIIILINDAYACLDAVE